MLIYRVEDAKGNGPYTLNNVFFQKAMSRWPRGRCIGSSHPMPHKDIENFGNFLVIHGCNVRFGFVSLKQLTNWFLVDSIDIFSETDFYIGVYQVPEKSVVYSRKQAAFALSAAVLIGRMQPG